MPIRSGAGRRSGRRALIVASRFNEAVTRKLLNGALRTLSNGGFPETAIDVMWVPGAFEIPIVVNRGLASERYDLAVAVGAVIRGETPHFDYIAAEVARGIADAAVRFSTPVGFGVLTCDTMDQALARAGGAAGNKGVEAAEAALETLAVLKRFE